MFINRVEAGQKLAEVLKSYTGRDVVVYALPRGGVTVAHEIAKVLRAPLDIVVVRKIGHPNNNEYAIAAVAEGGELVKNDAEVQAVDQIWFRKTVQREQEEIQRRRRLYIKGRSISANHKIAIVVDDGLATGLTMQAAVQSLRAQNPKKIIVALPVVPAESLTELKKFADEVTVLIADPHFLGAVGAYYRDFDQVSDREVVTALTQLYKNPKS